MKSTKTKRTGMIIAGHPNHLSEPTRRFLRGLLVFVLALGSLIALGARAQSNYPAPYYFNTFAGNAYGGNGTGSQAIFAYPYATAVDGAGNVYVADTYNYTVRKITPAGVVTTLAGLADNDGSTDGIAVDSSGNLSVADTLNSTIRKITSTGVVTTLAGTPGGIGSADGTGSAARFNYPDALTVAGTTLYVAEAYNSTIRKVTSTGVVTTFAGTAGAFGNVNGTGSAVRFNSPYGVAATSTGIIYVADSGNHEIRQITPARGVTTFAGSATTDGGGIGSADGAGRIARFNYPNGVAVSGTTVYVGDTYNHTIRKITSNGVVTTFAGTAGVPGSADGIGNAAQFYRPAGVAADKAGNVYVADASNSTIRKITSAGVVTTLAGTAGGIGSADGSGSAAQFFYPFAVAVDGAGNVYVADTNNYIVRKITPAGVVTTLAGLAGNHDYTDGTGSNARFGNLFGIAADSAGNVYVADNTYSTIRKISPAGIVTTLAGAPGISGNADGTGTAARFSSPRGIAIDSAKNLYVSDQNNQTIRKITPAGVVTTLGGVVGSYGIADGTGRSARCLTPAGIAVASSGVLYVADAYNHELRSR